MSLELIVPDWTVPARVKAVVTTRQGGLSRPPFAALNLAAHVGDDPEAVAANRALLRAILPAEPCWLEQVHGVDVVVPEGLRADRAVPRADAAVSRRVGAVCAVMTADCLPVLLCDDEGRVVAAAHAGWRGLCAGILERTVAGMAVAPAKLQAWLGPAIGPLAFVVGEEVRAAFLAHDTGAAAAFAPAGPAGKWLADLYELARRRLGAVGVGRVSGGTYCTYAEAERFYSYRRDRTTGRMASLIWLEP